MIIRILLTLLFIHYFQDARTQNVVNTYSGNGVAGFVNGSVDSASFREPFGLCIDKNHNLYVADAGNNCIRKIDLTTGIVYTLAGMSTAGYRDGIADSALFNSPSDLCVDDTGNVYVSDFLNQRIRKISVSGVVSTVAGSGAAGYLDGNHATARFNYPRGICIDPSGNLYVGDSWNHRIRKIDVSGMVSTFAGGGIAQGVSSVGNLLDGADTSARFYTPAGLAIDQYGNIFVADAYNHRIRKVDTSRYVTTLIGYGASGPGNGNYLNGAFNTARLNTPTELFVDTGMNRLYIGDTFNNRVRMADLSTSTVINFAGSGSASFVNDIDSIASFNYTRGIAKSDTALFVCDYNNHAIRIITPDNNTGILYNYSDKNQFYVYPNPSEGIVHICNNAPICNIELFNVNGHKILDNSVQDRNTFTVDLSAFERGVYLLILSDKTNCLKTKKVLVY